MVRLVIRDDDANFFTRPEDIEFAYKRIPGFPVSFACVPYVTDVIGGCPETKGNTEPRPIEGNTELVTYLSERVKAGKCDILLHGLTHGYHYDDKSVKIPEMVWRDNEDEKLEVEIKNARTYLEKVFGIDINCFVAPSNRILKRGIRAVYSAGMNYSGIVPMDFQRDLSLRSLNNYVRRCVLRLTKRIPYPGILDYGTHLELNACNTISYDYLVNMFHYCQERDMPMAINVHYWHMRDNQEQYAGFYDFILYAIEHGAVPSTLRDCFKR